MTSEEQDRRRALKAERRALDRAITAGALPRTTYDQLPTRWNHARRALASARSAECAYRAAGARIAAIGRELESQTQEENHG